MTDWNEGESTDARRDIAALLRAWQDGKQGDIDAVLDGAGERGTRCIAETLLSVAANFLAQLTVAVNVLTGESIDTRALIGQQPALRQVVEATIARFQDDMIAEGGA